MPEIDLGGHRVSYAVVTSRRATVGIEIRKPTGLLVRAPENLDEGYLASVLHKKAEWILKHLARLEAGQQEKPKLTGGMTLLYLGRNYRLDLVTKGSEESINVALKGRRIRVTAPKTESTLSPDRKIRAALVNWYRERAREILGARVAALSQEIGVAPKRIVIKDQRRRWGSCSRTGTLNLNWRIVMSPARIVDYLVAHELCHLRVPNHSLAFWQALETVIPDWRRRRKWLRKNGHCLEF
jgi:predicted metal-dependent hydrolase